MKIQLLAQPHRAPEYRLGEQLKRLLQGVEGHFERFEIAIAFVKLSGLSRLEADIQKFRKNGGRTIASVGINHNGTSKQGIRAILRLFDEKHVFYDRASGRTFHSKIYLFKSKYKAVAFIGSGNMTKGGLFTNYEANLRIDLDLGLDDDVRQLNDFEKLLGYYTDTGNPQVKLLDPALATRIEGVLCDEAGLRENDASDEVPLSGQESASSEADPLKGLFGTIHIAGAPSPTLEEPFRRSVLPHNPAVEKSKVFAITKGQSPIIAPPLGSGSWLILSVEDVAKKLFEVREPLLASMLGRNSSEAVLFVDGKATYKTKISPLPRLRPNEAGRHVYHEDSSFSFDNSDIFGKLESGDIILFTGHPLEGIDIVERIPATDPRHKEIRGKKKARFGVIGFSSSRRRSGAS